MHDEVYSPECVEKKKSSRKFEVASSPPVRYLPPSGVGLCALLAGPNAPASHVRYPDV